MYKIKLLSCLVSLTIFALLTISISAQPSTSASFTMRQSAVANGGGQSTGGIFTVTGTTGQALAGTTSTSPQFALAGGFWQPGPTPTAALVSISGRILTPRGQGIPRAFVTMIDQLGVTRTARANQFGYFRFNGIEAGQVVILNGVSKGFEFSPQVISVSEDIQQINLRAIYLTKKN